jgi:hypothetical protein
MHYGHDHHDHDQGSGAIGLASRPTFGPGHNHALGPQRVAQWQRPRLDNAPALEAHDESHSEPDFDLVETAFVDGFASAPDPTSFLRLAQVPFEAVARDGTQLALLRVEMEVVTDVASLMPHLGGASFRYDPLPAALVARRRRLRFVYGDGRGLRRFSFAEVRYAAWATDETRAAPTKKDALAAVAKASIAP